MDLLSAFKRKKKPAAPEAADTVQLARTRARHRLIGAAVLVVAGIVGLPLLFESEPRPIPVDLPIEIARKDNVAPVALPPAPAAPVAPAAKAMPKPAPPEEHVITESAADAGREVKPAASMPTDAPAEAKAAGAASAPAPRHAEAADEAPKPRAAAPQPAASAKGGGAATADAARAKALLEGRGAASADAPPPAPGAPRFVVQVGAFTDPAAVRTTRAKVEHLGLTTYTQVAQTPSGARTRVRVGPFATRAEAERAAARIKAADLPTVILTL